MSPDVTPDEVTGEVLVRDRDLTLLPLATETHEIGQQHLDHRCLDPEGGDPSRDRGARGHLVHLADGCVDLVDDSADELLMALVGDLGPSPLERGLGLLDSHREGQAAGLERDDLVGEALVLRAVEAITARGALRGEEGEAALPHAQHVGAQPRAPGELADADASHQDILRRSCQVTVGLRAT